MALRSQPDMPGAAARKVAALASPANTERFETAQTCRISDC